jgi:hypothetical protein
MIKLLLGRQINNEAEALMPGSRNKICMFRIIKKLIDGARN